MTTESRLKHFRSIHTAMFCLVPDGWSVKEPYGNVTVIPKEITVLWQKEEDSWALYRTDLFGQRKLNSGKLGGHHTMSIWDLKGLPNDVVSQINAQGPE